jgi:shikimate dehydrogenase
VNTLSFQRVAEQTTRILGDNTDTRGFVQALLTAGFRADKNGEAVVVGAGGAARAVVFGLMGLGLKDIVVLNRTVAHARKLVTDLASESDRSLHLEALPLVGEALIRCARSATLLVNATSVACGPT